MSIIQHNLFSPTCCNPCLLSPTTTTNNKPANLSKCLGCKLILYCSTAHQKLDWPIHKHFCKAVGTLLLEHKVNHLFAIAGPIRTKKDLSEITVKVKCTLVSLLKRKLYYHEEELTSFPVMCAVCFSTKRNKLYHCKECNAISYCCRDHELEYAAIHKIDCHQLKLHYCKFKIDLNYNFNLKPRPRCKTLESDLGKVMATAFGMELSSDPSESLIEYQKFSFASDFSCIATISYFVQYLEKEQEIDEEFTFYLAGSTVDEIWFTPIFTEFFFACFTDVLRLNIVFIGPEIPEGATAASTTSLDNNRTLFRTSFKGTLENYSKVNNTYLKPHLIACFNCGFSENARKEGPSDTWYEGIEQLIEQPEIPILFTSYTSLEADCDLRALEQVLTDKKDRSIRLEKIIEKQKNPYRDMRPLRSWQFNDPESLFYRNGYVQAVKFTRRTKEAPKLDVM